MSEIPEDAPCIVEIEGIKFAVPEPVMYLLKAVSEERDELEAENAALKREIVWHKGELEWLQGAYPVAYDALVDMRKEYQDALLTAEEEE